MSDPKPPLYDTLLGVAGTEVTPEQLIRDQTYKTWAPTSADGAIIGEELAARLPPPRPGWNEYFMGIAFAVARRGSCRRKQVGAILVDEDHRVVSSGYNGAPRGMPDCFEAGCDVRVIDGRESCVRTLHAESNAIDFAHRNANNVILYSTVIPCRPCALRIIQTGIVAVYYAEAYESQGTPDGIRLLAEAGIPLVQLAST